MCRNALLVRLIIASGVLVIAVAASAPAAEKKKRRTRPDPAVVTVEKVLRTEVAGPVDRRGQLAGSLIEHPDSAAARWQAGFVRDGGAWRPFDQPPLRSESDAYGKYLEHRKQAAQTAAGQLDLANWCHKQGLLAQERAHLHAALACGACDSTPQVVERLGYCRIAGQWLSYEQLLEWRRLTQSAKESVKKWETPLMRLAGRLSALPAQRNAAVANLKLTDTSAIPAVEYVLAGRSEDWALIAVEMLRQLDSYEAAIALARQAVFSPWPAVRQSAGAALKGRRHEDVVPELIGLLSTPITTSVGFFELPEKPGVLYYNLVLARETDNQFLVSSLMTADHTLEDQIVQLNVSVSMMGLGVQSMPATMQIPDVSLPRFHHDWERSISDRLERRTEEVSRENEEIARLNERISAALASVSGQDASFTPQDWWKWWADYSDTQLPGAKPVEVVSENETIGDPTPPPTHSQVISCFAAGTPVWTEFGARAIETIKVGDRVLAKDVETGELAYKPVLQTTVRPPKELTTLRFGDETIVCTGGHRFWSSGSGWLKARDLSAQTLLHTVTGNTPVWSAKKGSTAETYNLVVADFHTYFVGKTGVLCQDLLIPRSTNRVVPGLERSSAVAPKMKER